MSKKAKERSGAMKRVLHRENERQRRQEMANLYASLRTLLPLEYVKGKDCVVVTPGRDGVVEILINNFGLGLSGVLQELQAKGLGVVSCLSTKQNHHRFLHKIHAEVIDDLKHIDLPVMQERLLQLIN